MAKRKKAKTSRTKSPRRKSASGGLFVSVLRWTLVVAIWGMIAVGALVAWYAAELPSIIEKPGVERKPAITVRDVNGATVARYGEFKGNNIDVSELPPHLIYAVMAIEDRRFYQHFGVDPIGLARAVVRNAAEGRVVQGGSTITQQLAKNLFLSRERTFKRKVQEAILALWLEARMSKDEILSAYLNRVYLGAGTYGVEAAAQAYFNKSAREVTLRESAILAGLLKAPSRYSPTSNPRLAQERANTVIAAMQEAGYLTADEAGKLTIAPPTPPTQANADGNSEKYYADWVVGSLDELIGIPTEDIIIETTLVPEIQTAAEKALNDILEKEGKDKNVSQGAIILMARDGAVLAMVGGKNYGQSQFNRAVQSNRQPGSSFKPIVYLTALERGLTPRSIVIDEPITEGKYRPTNFNNEYYGEVPLDVALAFSLNTIAYQIARDMGVGYIIGTARRLGIESHLERDLSLALGSSGIPLIEMVTAYGTIANDGYQVKPYAIRQIRDRNGTLIYQRPNRPIMSGRPMFEPYVMRDLKSMMNGVTEFGTGQAARFGPPIAGKTGTSQDFRDAWFIGFSDLFIAGVWVGNDDNKPMKRVTGGSIPARIWRETMIAAHNSAKGRGFSTSAPVVYEDYDANRDPSSEALLGEGVPLGSSNQNQAPDDFGDFLRRLITSPSTPTAVVPSSTPEAASARRAAASGWKFND
jgi:penicillin-binding protein 1A